MLFPESFVQMSGRSTEISDPNRDIRRIFRLLLSLHECSAFDEIAYATSHSLGWNTRPVNSLKTGKKKSGFDDFSVGIGRL